jgi:hypothetical protein
LLPEPEPRQESGIDVHPIIWRAWRAWGGERMFGKPLAPPEELGDGAVQLFENARFEYRPAESDSRFVVELSPLGERTFGEQPTTPSPRGNVTHSEQTEPKPDDVFAEFWQRHNGPTIFGDPITPPSEEENAEGEPVIRQTFQRAVMERPSDSTDTDDVRLLPLGRIVWAQDDAASEQTSVQVR